MRITVVLRTAITVFALTFVLGAEPAIRNALLNQYCVTCHNQRMKSGGLTLEGIPVGDPAARPDVWEKVVRKLQAGEMPPTGMPSPDESSLKAFTAALTSDIDAAARQSPFAGRPVVRRLNRNEYSNAIRDLLAIELPVAAELPQDGIAAGFDNISDALSMSPLLLERYLKVARRVSELAVGTSEASPVTEIFPATGLSFGIVICNDSNYLGPARLMAVQGATALFVPTRRRATSALGAVTLANQ